jgi:3-oxoacyl-[acyl-carrier protein] reductase
MDLGLKDKCVFVAGSSRGIGKGIAAAFLNEGARALITGRDAGSVSETISELSAGRRDRVMSFAGDLSAPQVLAAAKRQVMEHWGAVDCLVCNIGSGSARTGWNLDREDWNAAFDINFWATVGLVKAFVPDMVEARRGAIVMVSSIAGIESLGAPLPYGAAKAAIERYSKDLSRLVGQFGIRVNTLAPGNILFPGGNWQMKLDADSEKVSSMIAREVPLQRFGTPEEIGAAAVFLASKQAMFITGACLVVDGGQTRA